MHLQCSNLIEQKLDSPLKYISPIVVHIFFSVHAWGLFNRAELFRIENIANPG